jgi:hypothetical protein
VWGCAEVGWVEFAEIVRRSKVAEQPIGDMKHTLVAERVRSRRSKRRP